MTKPPDLETLARRYVDLWQDQVTALAADPEFTHTLGRLLQVSAAMGPAGWISLWTAAAAGLKGTSHERGTAHTASNSAPVRPPSAAAARDHGGADMAELRRRLADLEKRVAELNGKSGGANRTHAASVAPVAQGTGGRTPSRTRGRRPR